MAVFYTIQQHSWHDRPWPSIHLNLITSAWSYSFLLTYMLKSDTGESSVPTCCYSSLISNHPPRPAGSTGQSSVATYSTSCPPEVAFLWPGLTCLDYSLMLHFNHISCRNSQFQLTKVDLIIFPWLSGFILFLWQKFQSNKLGLQGSIQWPGICKTLLPFFKWTLACWPPSKARHSSCSLARISLLLLQPQRKKWPLGDSLLNAHLPQRLNLYKSRLYF